MPQLILEQEGFRQARRQGGGFCNMFGRQVKGSDMNLRRVFKEFHTVSFDGSTGSQILVPRLLSSTSHENFLGVQILSSCCDPTESETMGMGPSNLCSSKSSREL